MVTSKLDKRFTAQEALAFADSVVATVSPKTPILKIAPPILYYCLFDIWENLPADFVAKWANYREDRNSISFRTLNYLYTNIRYGIMFVYQCRQAARMALFIPRLIFRPLTFLSQYSIFAHIRN